MFFAIGNLLWFVVAIIAGTVVAAIAVVAAKQFASPASRWTKRPPWPPPNLPIAPKPTFGRERSSSSRHYVDLDNPKEKEHTDMPTKTVIVGSAIGLHARPAAIIAEAVVNAGVPVTLSMDGGEPVDAGSALMIMTLGAGNGAQVTVASEDEDALNTDRRTGAAGSRRLVTATACGAGRRQLRRPRPQDRSGGRQIHVLSPVPAPLNFPSHDDRARERY